MVRLATALVDEPSQAEEVVQEAFAALYLRYRVLVNPVAYLRVCVLNGGRKVLRRRRIVRRAARRRRGNGQLVFNHVIDAVRRLPTKQRNVVVLRYELQLSDPRSPRRSACRSAPSSPPFTGPSPAFAPR